MNQRVYRIAYNHNICQDYYKIGIATDSSFLRSKPGQFVMVNIGESVIPLLRRPFSIHRVFEADDSSIVLEILYKVVGQGTEILSTYETGKTVDIIGPLGQGFKIPADTNRFFITAGGVGIAPMPFLVSTILERRKIDLTQCAVYVGGRTEDDLLCREDFYRLAQNLPLFIMTEDGSAGKRGLITLLIEEALIARPPDIIFACGPIGMLKVVAGLAKKYDVPCQVSLETLMACGIGACMGCAAPKIDENEGYYHVCQDGPVFDARSIAM